MTKLLGEYRYMYISDTSLGYCLFSNTAPLFERLIAWSWNLLIFFQVIGASALILAYLNQHKPSVYCYLAKNELPEMAACLFFYFFWCF